MLCSSTVSSTFLPFRLRNILGAVHSLSTAPFFHSPAATPQHGIAGPCLQCVNASRRTTTGPVRQQPMRADSTGIIEPQRVNCHNGRTALDRRVNSHSGRTPTGNYKLQRVNSHIGRTPLVDGRPPSSQGATLGDRAGRSGRAHTPKQGGNSPGHSRRPEGPTPRKGGATPPAGTQAATTIHACTGAAAAVVHCIPRAS